MVKKTENHSTSVSNDDYRCNVFFRVRLHLLPLERVCLLPVLVQVRDVAERFEAERALILIGARVRRHMFHHRQLGGETLAAHLALEGARVHRHLARVLLMALHVERGAEHFAAQIAIDRVLLRVDRFHVLRHAAGAYELTAQHTVRHPQHQALVRSFVHFERLSIFEHLWAELAHQHQVGVRGTLVRPIGSVVEAVEGCGKSERTECMIKLIFLDAIQCGMLTICCTHCTSRPSRRGRNPRASLSSPGS